MATPYSQLSYGFRKGAGNYAYGEYLKKQRELKRQADFAERIAAEQERISLSQWEPKADETEVKIKTKADGTSTVVSTEKFPAQSLLDDPMGLEGTGTGNWGLSLLDDATLPQSDIYEYERINDLYANPPGDIGEIWPTPIVDPILEPVDTRPFNQQDIIIPDNIPRGWKPVPEVTVTEPVVTEPVVTEPVQDIPGVAYAQGRPVGGWGTGYQQDAPGMERMPAATDEDYRRIYGDQARVMAMRGLLEDEELATQYVDTTGRTAADYGVVRPPPNFAQRTRQGYFSRAEAPTYEEEIPVGPVPGTPEYRALVDSIQASEVVQPDAAIYGDSQALGTVDEARVGVNAAVDQIIPQPQAIQSEPQPQEVSPFAADQQRLIDESTQRYIQSQQPPVAAPIVTPSLLDEPEGWSLEDITSGQPEVDTTGIFEGWTPAEDVLPPVDPSLRPSGRVETDILESQTKGWIDPDTGQPFRGEMYQPLPKGAMRDVSGEFNKLVKKIRTGISEEDIETDLILDIKPIEKTVNKMYEMQKQNAMMALVEGMKKRSKARNLKVTGRRRQQREMALLNPTPLTMGNA